MSDQQSMTSSHISASRENVKARLHKDRQHRIDTTSPTRDIFQKTSAFITALQRLGCRGPIYEQTSVSAGELEFREFLVAYNAKIQRSYPTQPTCNGRLELGYGHTDLKPYIR
jgi:hypothetical protein